MCPNVNDSASVWGLTRKAAKRTNGVRNTGRNVRTRRNAHYCLASRLVLTTANTKNAKLFVLNIKVNRKRGISLN